MELLLFVMKVSLVVTIAVTAEEEQKPCTVYEERVWHGYGQAFVGIGRFGITINVTACMANAITENSPISFNEYSEHLTISRNGAVSKVYRNSFSLMPSLKTLKMIEEDVDEIESGAFNGLSNLKYLNFKLNNLRNLPEDVFADVPSLEELDLSFNNLAKINRHLFDNLGNLKTLLLNNNKLREFEDQWYTGLGSLQYLGLIGNRLPKVKTKDYYGLCNLETLRIEENNISIVERDGFKGLVNLKELFIHHYENNVVRIEEVDIKHELENMPKLEILGFYPGAFECGVISAAEEYLANVSRSIEFSVDCLASCWE